MMRARTSSPVATLLLLGLFYSTTTSVIVNAADNVDDDAGVSMTNYEILLRLFDATRGLRWTDHTGWLANKDLCTWKGITCWPKENIERSGHISQIDLSENHLVGKLPPEVFDLPHLDSLILHDNADLQISFVLRDDELGSTNSAASLKHLSLTNTDILSLEGIRTAANLETLRVENAQLDGTMPHELFELTHLTGLFASSNKLTGTLPTLVGQLEYLQQFFLSDNALEGQLPTELGSLLNLKILMLGENVFNGTLPEQLNACTSLERLSIPQGDDKANPDLGLVGPIPSFLNAEHLTEIYLQNNRLTGSIPNNFLKAAPKDEIIKLDLGNNQLTGAVPPGWGDFHRLRPILKDNQLVEFGDSDLCTNAKDWFPTGSAKLPCPDSVLCPPGTYASQGRATATEECQECEAATFYGMTFCLHLEIGGSATLESEKDILELMYHRMGGPDWFATTNWLEDDDVCKWYGIECSPADDGNRKVIGIRMKNNQLRNVLPAEVFALPDLIDLNLNSNAVSFSFQGIGKATNLKVLDLTNTELESLEGIEELSQTKVTKLRLASNHIKGTIPTILFQLTTLLEINLSNNQFSGQLPTQVGALGTKLERLSSYSNELTGPLPSELGQLTNLIQLDLSENSFTGSLPPELEQMTALKTFTIHQTSSYNGLTGQLPAFEALTQLTSLHLEANQLTGPLPPTFLANTIHGNNRIEVRLHDNSFEGIVPSEWAGRFEDLFIDLTGNRIVALRREWCVKEDWMDGGVAEFDCDAILCRAGTFNEFGRRTNVNSVCQECPDGGNLLGARKCGASLAGESLTTRILTEFYYATGGSKWTDNAGWMQSSDFCSDWTGVYCDANGHVAKIVLKEHGLTGTLPSSLFTLPSLQHIDVGGNHELTVSLEGIEKAKILFRLMLNNVHIDSIAGISKATSLQELHLSKNDLTGSIPDEILELTQLTYLSLTYNHLTGRIPNAIAELSLLETLYLDSNQIDGQLPAAIGSLKALRILSVSENQLTGTIPQELNELTNIEELMLHKENGVSSFDGSSSSGPVGAGIRGPLPSFKDLKHLKMLTVSDNSLTGEIPFNFLDGLLDKTKNIYVDIASNELEGRVPASLTQFDKMSLYAVGNKFTDIAPGLCLKEDWMMGLVKDYGCNAILCPPSTYNEFGFELSTPDHTPCKECKADGVAPFYGSTACLSVSEMATSWEGEILTEFFHETDGLNWKEGANWLDDSVSICSWFGVTCVSEDDQTVQSLHLPTNGLNGTIPVSVFSLKNLTEIDFSGNSVQVNFNDADDISAVTYINLDATGLASISGIIGVAPDLKSLHVKDNNFDALPSEIFNLFSLEALYMSNNDFTGEFPAQLAVLENLIFLNCDECGLTGTLPTSIGFFEKLELLSLFGNSLTGPIPVELMLLTNLKHLDLAVQKDRGGEGFSGTLPDFAGLPNLGDLFLSWNSLSGPIPTTLLSSVDGEEFVSLDLRNNILTGAIPVELAKFTKMDFFLANNNIDEVPQIICDLPWNTGIVSDNGCDHIVCRKGSYNLIGYATATEECVNCSEEVSTNFLGSTQCGEDIERVILSNLFVDLSGHDWSSHDGWLTNDDVCNWSGIACYEEGAGKGHVREIDLSDNNMKGTVSSSIFDLQLLKSLDFRSNEVVLPFEDIGNAKELISLQLSDTPVKSIQGISNAAGLVYLHLTDCNMTDSIPDELFDLSNLQGLFMNYNFFAGSLSTRIANLTELRELYIFENALSGSIPTEIGMLTNLYILGLGENKLTGTLPTELSLLTNMQILSLQQERGLSTVETNIIDGEFGIGLTGPLLSFDTLPSLRELYLGKNSFHGAIPDNFLSAVHNLTRTMKVDLTNNNLAGSIPSALSRFEDLRLFVAGNRINHVPDELCDKHSWMKGLMDSGCDALLCEPGSFNEYGRRIDSKPCQPCAFNASSYFYGSESCIAQEEDDLDERSILFQLYNALDGKNWKNKDNWLEDNRPICKWHGVHCATENNVSGDETVVSIELPSNGLKGIVPASVYHLSSLMLLNIRGNEVALSFHGAETTTTLEELYLDKTSVSSLKGIGKISPLKVLHVEDNDFEGDELPHDLFDLSNLEVLDISNSAFGGVLPTKIGQMTSLKQLYCHKNDLSGTLPTTFGLLKKLEILELSENTFVGTLPVQMDGMTSLKSFFLDSFTRNGAGISGPLLSFSKMPQLRDVFIGSQTLTGTIPTNFLAGIQDTAATINVGLSGNSLTGVVPGKLAFLERVNIDITDNLFEGIDDTLCDQSRWMGGAVETFSCNAILCSYGTFNGAGRQTNTNDPCIKCVGSHGSDPVPYLGSVTCLPLQKQKERQILELLYQVTGGDNWKQQDGWMDESIDMCKWHGISCRDDFTVASIVLGSNNLSGRPPKELFDIKNLHFLWLYSNPIEFSFDGIQKAKKLTSLLLDSTGLKSLMGLENAYSLTDVDVRFNSLTGTLPVFKNLPELASLSVGHNAFSGTVPSFSSNRKLRTLRLGDNEFTGTVPDFGLHEILASIDLSDNKLTGTIPVTLLQSVESESKIFIDLSSNQLTGTVPGEFTNYHEKLTIYLRDNKLEGIDDALCSAEAYNDGDVIEYSCDGILCKPGTYAPGTGRASRDGTECLPCPEAKYFGSSTCGEPSAAMSYFRTMRIIPSLLAYFLTVIIY